MIDEKRIKEAKENYDSYLRDGRIKRISDIIASDTYAKNSSLSLRLAEKIMRDSELKPYLWAIVCSYYSMFYMANSVLNKLGYKIEGKEKHKVTNEALLVLILPRLRKEIIEEYEKTKEDAEEIADIEAGMTIENFEKEMKKRGKFQYEMSETVKEQIALTSLERAKRFSFEMKRFLYL